MEKNRVRPRQRARQEISALRGQERMPLLLIGAFDLRNAKARRTLWKLRRNTHCFPGRGTQGA